MNNSTETVSHSLAHILAQAVLRIYPNTKLGIGPAIQNGFYYDFEFEKPLLAEDLPRIEDEMRKIVSSSIPFTKSSQTKKQALLYFQKLNQPYKIEIVNDIPDKKVSFYSDGDFTDLCRGPHIENTSEIGAFKLTHIAGAYWKGDEKRPMLQRVYGLSFATNEELESYLKLQDEMKDRDHRKLGKDLELFTISEMVGVGLPLWLPNGAFIRRKIEDFEVELINKNEYSLVYTPHIGSEALYTTSGHLQHYKDSMYPPIDIDGKNFYLKPMSCPHHIQIFDSKPRSYRDLPVRLAEIASVYRYEKSGEVSGLSRVRGFAQDDGHVFMREDQLKDEVKRCYSMVLEMLTALGLPDFKVRLSLRDANNKEKYFGDEDAWNRAENILREVLVDLNIDYVEGIGEAAYYAPKLDFMFYDVFGREWQLSTIQVDLYLPERFNLNYTGEDGALHRIVMIHRALVGSMERFMSMYIEHTGGNFPFWLSPIQIVMIPISQNFNEYALNVKKVLGSKGYRVNVDDRDEKMQAKIRDAQMKKIPYMLIVGSKEMESNTVSIRERSGKTMGVMTVDEFITKL